MLSKKTTKVRSSRWFCCFVIHLWVCFVQMRAGLNVRWDRRAQRRITSRFTQPATARERSEVSHFMHTPTWAKTQQTGSGFYHSCPPSVSTQTQVLYRWVEPKICVENVTGAVKLPATGQREPCPPCNPGYYNSNDSTCLPCPPGTHSDGIYGKKQTCWAQLSLLLLWARFSLHWYLIRVGK